MYDVKLLLIAEEERVKNRMKEHQDLEVSEKWEEKNDYFDYVVRKTAASAEVLAFACTTRDMAQTARIAHNTSPIVTAALGRLMAAGAMMGVSLKGERDLLTLIIRGDGPIEGITVTADASGNVKGYPAVTDVLLPPSPKGKLDVGRAVGKGTLQVIMDMGLKEPYSGQTELQTGEIAEDLTYYFAVSQQVPSAVGLGVLMNKDNTVRQAGGFIIQLMPFCREETIACLEANLAKAESVTDMLDRGISPEQMLDILLEGLEPEQGEQIPTRFRCNCSKEKVQRALLSLGEEDYKEILEDGAEVEVGCRFCGKKYFFTQDELTKCWEERRK
jgi:molecular chaperone Hsp33